MRAVVIALGLGALFALAGCTTPAPDPVAAPTAQLRIRNTGPADARDLRVAFPHAEVAFGDVPARSTSGYRPVPGGVYRYGAYRLNVEGKELAVPVIDWVGESPLAVGDYTYELAVDPGADQPVTLVRVQRDR
jgi:hypothetical protein